ncbi:MULTISPECIES: zinc-ribbon and DUF3426 domain-containing protein [unclassified Variovorax]|uniref:zinc-ribbon and DUF3426 domain-containing protein n=1 Tax=unclassified Variovorax TaxID=663243 RepID=UPI003F46841D
MSLVTRCPACTTTFKVVRDQLRISDGWVRCGRCSHVFDATLDLHEAPDGAPPPVQGGYMPGLVDPSGEPKAQVPVVPEVPPPPAPEPEPEPDLQAPAPQPEDADFFDEELELPSRAEHTPPAPVPVPVPESIESATPPAFSLALPDHGIAADEPWSDLDVTEPAWKPPASTLPPFPNIDLNLASPPPASRPPAPPLPVVSRIKARALIERASDDGEGEREQEEKDHDQVQMQKALRRARTKSAKIAGAKARDERAAAKAAKSTDGAVVQVASEPDYSLSSAFEPPVGHPLADEDGHAHTPPGFWHRTGVRMLLIVLALLAVLLLAAQVLRHNRDGIAARQPNLRAVLAVLCQYTGCELAALRQIGDIVIEGAAFAREKTGVNDYRLSFTLRNGATVPLAMPAVELSLLDTQERAVVRRVLMPADYGAPAVLQARTDRAASLPLSLSASEAAALPPIAGYRVEAFYP